MNLLVTIPSLEVGGAEIFLARLLNFLANEKGVRIFLLDFEKEKRDHALIETFSDKIKIIDNPLGNTFIKKALGKIERIFGYEPDTFSYRFYDSFINRKIRKYKISLIHSHLYRSDRIIARCVKNVPAITTLHGCYNFFGSDKREEIYRVLSTFRQIIYIADRNLAPIMQLPEKEILLRKTVKLYNGLDPSAILAAEEKKNDAGTPRVIIVSRCIREKGWDMVIEAVKQLNNAGIAIELDLVGDGHYLETLKQKHKEAFIIFSGKVMNVNAHIAKAWICCFPSLYPNESLPNSVMEYMAHKKPIITNRIGEVEQMVTTGDGKLAAILAPAEASEQELVSFYAKEIKALLNDPSKCEQLSVLAGEAVKKFDIKQTAEAYLKLYNTFKEN